MAASFRPLKQGDAVAVVSPADWLEEERLDAAAAALAARGFDVRVVPQNRMRRGRLAGGDAQRAAALMDAYADPSVRAILCARGGYGSVRLVDRLDWTVVAANPKPLVGYSDITALLTAVHRRLPGHAWHGPILKDFADPRCRVGPDLLASLLRGENGNRHVRQLMRGARPLVQGTATGPLIGGNLSLLTNAVGTWNDIETDGAILFIEDVDEALYAIDRMLWQLRRAGKLRHIAGLMIGEAVRITQEGEDFPFGFDELIVQHFGALGVPVATNVPCAHGPDRLTLPLGWRATLTVGDAGADLEIEGCTGT